MRSIPPARPPSDGLVMLRLRREQDFDAVTASQRDPLVARWLSDTPVPSDSPARSVARAADQWSSGRATPFVIADATTSLPLGLINLRFDGDHEALVAYSVFADARGRGIAGRALALVTAWAIPALGLERIVLEADRLNTASVRVAEKSGFRWSHDRPGDADEGTDSVIAVFEFVAPSAPADPDPAAA
jgi:RimJ/RimL family protein N-acetyltransferase